MATQALSFVSFQPVLRRRHARQTVQKRARPLSSRTYFAHIPRSCATPPPSPQANDTLPDMKIPGTPCFTSRIMASPMPSERRHVYLQAAAAATARYLADFQPGVSAPVSQVTLLVPQLNPELDVYDRRFLLSLAWAVLDVTAFSCRLRSRVLIQGTGAFGAVPLSVSGLRRNFDADLNMSQEAWTENIIRSGALENVDDLDEEDDIIIVVSPTNAVSIPVIDNLTDMVARARGRPVILLNPRLADVPSHSGVMQVSGRAERMRFLENIDHIFYLRLLFSAGKVRILQYQDKLCRRHSDDRCIATDFLRDEFPLCIAFSATVVPSSWNLISCIPRAMAGLAF